jgi:tetratricopeptide (TPR) repeat protein
MNFHSLHLDKLYSPGKKVPATRMDSKNLRFTKHALCALLATMPLCELQAQPAEPAAPAEQPAGELETLFADAEKAFGTKDYATAVGKLETLLKAIAENKAVPAATLEMIRFNIGLGYLLMNDAASAAKAEVALTECLTKHPKGEYSSRCYLGVGKACIIQGTPEKKEKAINALRQAAMDPKYRSEAGLALGQVYSELGRQDEAFQVFRTLMGSDVRTPQQTGAAVEVIGLLAESEKLDDLTAYLDRVINQPGIRDAIAWYTNQIVVRANDLSQRGAHEIALALYRSIPPRRQVLETQRASLEEQKREVADIEKKIADEIAKKVPIARRSQVGEAIGVLKAALELNTQALAAIEAAVDLDADLLLGRGRSLYYLERYEEALVCFRTIRNVYPAAKNLETAAYSEIVTYNQLKNTDELQKRAAEFLTKHPGSTNLEQIAMIAGQGLADAGKWDEMIAFYKDLAARFDTSKSKDQYVFFQAYGLFRSGKFAEAGQAYSNFVQTFPESERYEDALYQIALCNFIQGKFKETLGSIQDYLKKFPRGRYSGDLRYRLAYIDFRDTEDQSEKLVKEINAFVTENIDDPSAGAMLNLLGDTYSQKKTIQEKLKDQKVDPQDKALESYMRAANSESNPDVIRYAVEQATIILQAKKDWNGLVNLHQGMMKRYPGSDLALISTTWVVKMMVRENKAAEAAELLANTLKDSIADPSNEQVESLIDEMVRTLVPPRRAKGAEVNPDALFEQLNKIFDKAAEGQENPTTFARKNYAGARLFDMLRLPDRSDQLLKAIALNSPPEALSPMLLSACGEILVKDGQIDKAEGMFLRIVDRYQESPFADSGPVGLGLIALKKGEFQSAMDHFTFAIDESQGSSKFREANIGRVEALAKLGKLDEAETAGLALLADRSFKGEPGGQVYLLVGDIFKARAATKGGAEKEEQQKKANSYYQNAFARFKAYPEIAAEGLWRSSEVLKDMGLNEEAETTLKILRENEKFKNTPAFKKAQ